MATKHDEFKVYYFSFDEDELIAILDALRKDNNEELYGKIYDGLYGEEEDEPDHQSNIASLIFDIDCSAAGKATDELAKLKDAVDALAKSYDRLNDAQKCTVEYSLDATDRLIKEFLSVVSR